MGRPRKYATETERIEARRKSRREWAQRNPEKGKAYYEAHKEERKAYNRRWREQNVAKVMVDRARRRAEKKYIEFDLDPEFVALIIPLECPVFHFPLSLANGVAAYNSPSLDRKDPRKGYVRGNVQVISNKANMMKQDATDAELKQFAKWILSR